MPGCDSAMAGRRTLGPGLMICDPSGKKARYVAVGSGRR